MSPAEVEHVYYPADPPGVPLGGSNALQPSFNRSRNDAVHFSVRSGFTATTNDVRLTKCARETV